MRKKALILLLCTLSGWQAHAQGYKASDIPSELKKGADAVLRFSEETFTVSDSDEAMYTEKAVYTILNEDGFGFAVFTQPYDQFSKVRNIKITYYDANGKTLKKVRSGDIEDINYTSSGSVYDDLRMKYYAPEEYDYPFTVAYEYTKPTKSTYVFVPFVPQFTERVSVEKASFRVTVPADYNLRHKEINGIDDPVIATDGNSQVYTWYIDNEKAIQSEIAGANVRSMAKSVLLAPSAFAMEGYEGDMSTWKSFGLWQKKLNEGRDVLPQKIKDDMKALMAGVTDDKEKVRLVYDYLQNSTRYVSIQLGIGGWQPFPAISVAENGYGDCKALSNYTASLLKEVGIKSNYVIIKAGDDEDDIVTDFPSNQFNHVILAVPMESDTVWLECTSQEAPFNFLGSFTSDRHALMITDEGGVLVKTPEYTVEQNGQFRNAKVVLDKDGNAKASVKTVYKGRQYGYNYGIAKKGREDQRKYLLNVIDIPTFDLGTFDYKEEKTEDPTLTETYDLTLRKYGSTTGKRLFFVPNMLNKTKSVPPKDENRNSPIIRRYNYMDIDSVVYELPENYRVEFEPEPVSIDSEFGQYSLSYNVDVEKNQLTFVRHIKVYKGRYPANSYADFRNFWRKVARADKSKLVLIGST